MGDILPKMEGSIGIMISTPLFFLVFIGITWWVYRRKRKSFYEHMGKLPLEDSPESVEEHLG